MKAILLEIINDRLVQVDQLEIPDGTTTYVLAKIPPININGSDLIAETVDNVQITRSNYYMVARPTYKMPALFILDKNL